MQVVPFILLGINTYFEEKVELSINKLTLLNIFIIAPVVEEIICRYLLDNHLIPELVLNAIFVLLHFSNKSIITEIIRFSALLFLRQECNKILLIYSILYHGMFNSFSIIIFWLFKSKPIIDSFRDSITFIPKRRNSFPNLQTNKLDIKRKKIPDHLIYMYKFDVVSKRNLVQNLLK